MVANRPAGLSGSRTRSGVMTTKPPGATTSPGRAALSSQTIMAATDSAIASTSARRSSSSSQGFRQMVSGNDTIAAASLKFSSSRASQSCGHPSVTRMPVSSARPYSRASGVGRLSTPTACLIAVIERCPRLRGRGYVMF